MGSELKSTEPSVLTVAYDLETTGFNMDEDRIVQFAAVVVCITGAEDNGSGSLGLSSVGVRGSCDHFVSMVNPGGRRMHPRASLVTGITNRQVENAEPFQVVWGRFMKFLRAHLGDYPMDRAWKLRLVGHNSRKFDDIMLCATLGRHDNTIPTPFCGAEVVCSDTLCAAKKAGLPVSNRKLGTLFQWCTGNPLCGAHDALVDCRAVVALLSSDALRAHMEWEPWECRRRSCEDRREALRSKQMKRAPLGPKPTGAKTTEGKPTGAKTTEGKPTGANTTEGKPTATKRKAGGDAYVHSDDGQQNPDGVAMASDAGRRRQKIASTAFCDMCGLTWSTYFCAESKHCCSN